MSLWHVSPLKGPSSGSTTDTFQQQGQQNDLPDVKLNLAVCDMLHSSHTNISHTAKLNFTYGKSFCCPCCWNASVVLPEDGPLRGETCRSDILLIKWC